ncbi:tRNA (guanosine(37)-N1)-methyltransferase TrmD [Citroniella saccharovorans]|uniref:tRNA (guanosine(37)-N1)-methyltransferase TrmD n=1 Tax=Citroniella saccharovorans TaxID=2053367 RepID=UPI003613321C
MIFNILTLFPELFIPLKEYGIIGKAIKEKIISLNLINIRDFSKDSHKKVDDEIYGGGPGMLMTCQPIVDSIRSVKNNKSKVIYLSPQGSKLNHNLLTNLSREEDLILLCGHYEGIDQRVIDLEVDMEISIGDFVVSGGEIPAMILVDSISRLVDGVVGNEKSVTEDSFYNGLLKYPVYTRPRVFEGLSVPDILLSGDHKKIEEYRKKESLRVTKEKRSDLIDE